MHNTWIKACCVDLHILRGNMISQLSLLLLIMFYYCVYETLDIIVIWNKLSKQIPICIKQPHVILDENQLVFLNHGIQKANQFRLVSYDIETYEINLATVFWMA